MDGTQVTGFESANGKVTKVKTMAGDFEAEQIVLAARAWTPSVAKDLKLNIPIQPARGYSMTMSATKTMPSHALILGERRIAVSPMAALLRFTGRLEVGNYSMEPNPIWIQRIETSAREYLRLDEKLDVNRNVGRLAPDLTRHTGFIVKTGTIKKMLRYSGYAATRCTTGTTIILW